MELDELDPLLIAAGEPKSELSRDVRLAGARWAVEDDLLLIAKQPFDRFDVVRIEIERRGEGIDGPSGARALLRIRGIEQRHQRFE